MRYQLVQESNGLYALAAQSNGTHPPEKEVADLKGKKFTLGELCTALRGVPRDDAVNFDDAFMAQVFDEPESDARLIFDSYWSRHGCSCPQDKDFLR